MKTKLQRTLLINITDVPAGIWGSAFTVLLQRVLRERKLPSDTVDEMSNQGDLREELRMSFGLLFIMPKILKFLWEMKMVRFDTVRPK